MAAKRRRVRDKHAATLGKLTSAEREKVEKAYTRWAREDAALRAKMAAATRASRSAAAAAAAESGREGDAFRRLAETRTRSTSWTRTRSRTRRRGFGGGRG